MAALLLPASAIVPHTAHAQRARSRRPPASLPIRHLVPYGRIEPGPAIRLVVRDSAAFDSLWHRISARNRPPLPVPGVDFQKEMVIALGAGSTGGFGIMVESVRPHEDDDLLEVRVSIAFHEAFCGESMDPSVAPGDIVVVPRSNLVVYFVERSVEVRCPPP